MPVTTAPPQFTTERQRTQDILRHWVEQPVIGLAAIMVMESGDMVVVGSQSDPVMLAALLRLGCAEVMELERESIEAHYEREALR